jgi:hypothetical protein
MPLLLGRRPLLVGDRPLQGRPGLVPGHLVLPRVDLVQQRPLVDLRPFLDVDLHQLAADAGPDLDPLDGLQVPGVLAVVGDRPGDRLADRHLRRRRGRRRRRLPGAPGDGGEGEGGEQCA